MTRPKAVHKKTFDHEAAPRKCLRCQKMFLSAHIGNRMCDNCKASIEFLSPIRGHDASHDNPRPTSSKRY